ncbi:MAG: hypothetical protein U1F16_02130 [Turneriella sp.]
MDPKAATKIGKSLRHDYMGDVAVNGDPKVTARIGDFMEVDLIVSVVREMVKRQFYEARRNCRCAQRESPEKM